MYKIVLIRSLRDNRYPHFSFNVILNMFQKDLSLSAIKENCFLQSLHYVKSQKKKKKLRVAKKKS